MVYISIIRNNVQITTLGTRIKAMKREKFEDVSFLGWKLYKIFFINYSYNYNYTLLIQNQYTVNTEISNNFRHMNYL